MAKQNTISELIEKQVGKKPTYNEFYKSYLEAFYKLYPNSTAPKNSLISDFYDDFINPKTKNTIIGY